MQQVTINIEITGTTPMLVHKFTDKEQLKASLGQSSVSIGDKGEPYEQAEDCLYKSTDGRPTVPQPNLFACIMAAGKFFKDGKNKITTTKSSILTGCVDIHGVEFPIDYKNPWTVDTRPVRIPSTGGRILRHRPKFDDWKLSFMVSLDTSIMHEKTFREIVDAAGKRIGLGDFRPDCKGPFGKFVVTKWIIEK